MNISFIFLLLLYIFHISNLINISDHDWVKLLLGYLAIIFYNIININPRYIPKLILIYGFIVCFMGWELLWTEAPYNIYQCFDKPAMDYKSRAQICNLREDQITRPQILHSFSNTMSDIFIMLLINKIGLAGVDNPYVKPYKFINILKFIIIITMCGLSQNMMIDSFLNAFPKYCCGFDGKQLCPLSWAPLAPCQFCPESNNIISICWRTEFSWFVAPILTYILTIITVNY